MKKSKYISKYDYLGYYTKQPAMWFYSNDEIKAAIDYELNNLNKKIEDNVEIDEDEDNEIDAFEYYREAIFDNQNVDQINEKDFQKYVNQINNNETYADFLEKTKQIDENNILMVQGNILDKMSKEHIINEYKKYTDVIIDYDDQKYRGLNSDKLFELTIDAIKNHESIILFQPTFIWKEMNLITKCDAFVKIKDDIYIIETKGTSSTKRIHVFDLFYQHKVVESCLNDCIPDNTFIYFYRLCIIDYVLAPKFTAPFIIVETTCINKTPKQHKKNSTLDIKRLFKHGIYDDEKYNNTSYFDDIFTWNAERINEDEEEKNISKAEAKARRKIVAMMQEFYKVIDSLKKRKAELEEREKNSPNHKPDNFVPSYQDKGDLKYNDFWVDLKKLYINKGYEIFKYSGNFAKIPAEIMSKISQGTNITNLIKILKENDITCSSVENDNSNFFNDGLPAFTFNSKSWEYHISKLKDKKVYFDFESINTAIRAVDNSTPFLQAITQCSIIKDHNDNTPISEAKCINMCRHPKHIDISWMKEIIDNLYEGEDYSYIVYNKSFEKTRLNEMADFINESEYRKKAKCIIDNIVDLAEWYNYKGKSIEIEEGKKMKIECPIVVKQLHGFYSIKKVLPLVNIYNPQIYQDTKCVSYVDGLLTVHNGTECQTQTTKYFFDIPTELTWEEFLASIECYCENDVRAMIAVEYLAKDIAKNLNYYNDLAKKYGY